MTQQVSEHFNRGEFACKCGCGFAAVDVELLSIAEMVRSFIGPFTPNSVCRCVKHNKDIGGAEHSKHLWGIAMDIPSKNPLRLFNYLNDKFPDKYGIGIYDWGVHIDVRLDGPKRWDRRGNNK